jgi:hypothetical protein
MKDYGGYDHGHILRADCFGRVTTTREWRAALLAEFDQSGMSGQQFAKWAGVKYPTWASWVQKRRKEGANSFAEGQAKGERQDALAGSGDGEGQSTGGIGVSEAALGDLGSVLPRVDASCKAIRKSIQVFRIYWRLMVDFWKAFTIKSQPNTKE